MRGRENRPSVPPVGGHRREMPSSVPVRGGGAGLGWYSRGLFSARAVRRPGFQGAPRLRRGTGGGFSRRASPETGTGDGFSRRASPETGTGDGFSRRASPETGTEGGVSRRALPEPDTDPGLSRRGTAPCRGPWLRPRYFRAFGRAAEQSHRLLRAPPRREGRPPAARPHFSLPRCKPETKARYDGGVSRALAPRRGPRHEHRLP